MFGRLDQASVLIPNGIGKFVWRHGFAAETRK